VLVVNCASYSLDVAVYKPSIYIITVFYLSEKINLFPHPQPLCHVWERGDIILVPLLPNMGEGVRG
jgi:hypothetical protein